VVALAAAQAEPRAACLRALGEGRYEVLAPVHFKAGELIGVAGDLPKTLATAVQPASEPAAAPAPRRRRAAQAPAAAEA